MKDLNLIRKIAWKFQKKTGFDYNELFSEAALAYCEAEQKYDDDKGTKLSTFAYRCMNNHLINFCKKETNRVNKSLSVNYFDESENHCVDEFLMMTGLTEIPTDPVHEIINEWPEDCQVAAKTVFKNPERFLGQTPNFKRTQSTPRERIKTALREMGWTYARVQHTVNDVKTLIHTL